MSISAGLIVTIGLLLLAVGSLTWALGFLMGRQHRASDTPVPELLRPVGDGIERLSARLEQVERQRAAEQAELAGRLTEQVGHVARTAEEVRREAGSLQAALGRSTVTGAWGEASLQRMVEASGLLQHVHFTQQDHHQGTSGGLRPDMTIELGHGRQVAVDAKVSLEAFLRAQGATDSTAREAHLRDHAAAVARHVDALGSKEYWKVLDSCEFVVAFLPSEALLSAALHADPGLLQRAFDKSVVLATPATMFAVLRSIEMGWRQQALAENAAHIASLGREIYDRLATMAGHLDRLGKDLESATKSYNSYVGSLESRVLVSARRMSELGVGGAPVAVRQVENSVRSLAHGASEDIGPSDPPSGHGAAVA